MKLYEPQLEYIKSHSDYYQGIKGRKNYEHRERHSGVSRLFNGFGGEYDCYPSELILHGKLGNGKRYSHDIKKIILKTFDRKRLSEKFINGLNAKLNFLSYIELESNGNISEAEIYKIFFNRPI